MSRAVFLSYARKSSDAHALALHAALGSDHTFLDTSDIEAGNKFPEEIANAVLEARVVVIFAEPAYFESWYCRAEMRLALAPFYCGLPINHIVVALAPGTDTSQLPPAIASQNLLPPTDTDQLADFVLTRLAQNPQSLGNRIHEGEASRLKKALISDALMPRPQKLGKSWFPNDQPFPASIHDRFVGRADDLYKIDQTLAHIGTGAAAVAGQVSAAGGFGKTRLAIEYVHRYAARRFPGGVFWLDASASADNLDEQFHGMWSKLDCTATDLKRMREANRPVAPELARALKSIEQPILFVIDNLPESSPAPSLSDYCPALGHVTVLATSRQVAGDLSVRKLQIHTLPRLASVLLLMHDLPNPGALTIPEWERIAEAVGDLPLALDLLNAVLRHDLSPAQLLHRLEKATTIEDLDASAEALKGVVSPGALRGITETFALSFERLSPTAQKTAATLSHLLPGAPIPEAILGALPEELNGTAVRSELRARHWIQPAEGKNVFGTLHRLMAQYLRKVPASSSRFTATSAVLDVMTPDLCRSAVAWQLMGLCEPHAFELLGPNLDLDAAFADERYASVCVSLGHNVGILAFDQGDYPAALTIRRIVYYGLTKFITPNHYETIAAMSNLAESCRQDGDLANARYLQEKVLAFFRQSQREDNRDTLVAMNNLAATLHRQHYFTGARELYEHVFAVRQKLLEAEDPDLLVSMGNLGEIKCRQKDYVGARALQESVLTAWRRKNEPIQTATALNNLAFTVWKLDDLPLAYELMKESEEILRSELGATHAKSVHARETLDMFEREIGQR